MKSSEKNNSTISLTGIVKKLFGDDIEVQIYLDYIRKNKGLHEEIHSYRSNNAYIIPIGSKIEKKVTEYLIEVMKQQKISKPTSALTLKEVLVELHKKGYDYLREEDLEDTQHIIKVKGRYTKYIQKSDLEKAIRNGEFELIPYEEVLKMCGGYRDILNKLLQTDLRITILRDLPKTLGLYPGKVDWYFEKKGYFLKIRVKKAKKTLEKIKKKLLLVQN